MKSIASCVSTVVSTCASTCAIGIGAALLAGCAGPSGSMPQFLAATAPPAAAPGEGTRPPDSRSLGLTRSERLQTAKFVEGLSAYRTDHDGGAPILRNAKIRGPIDRAASGQGEQTYYCVSAEIGDSRPPVIPFGGPSAQLTSLDSSGRAGDEKAASGPTRSSISRRRRNVRAHSNHSRNWSRFARNDERRWGCRPRLASVLHAPLCGVFVAGGLPRYAPFLTNDLCTQSWRWHLCLHQRLVFGIEVQAADRGARAIGRFSSTIFNQPDIAVPRRRPRRPVHHRGWQSYDDRER
jgi:hypothetical protein